MLDVCVIIEKAKGIGSCSAGDKIHRTAAYLMNYPHVVLINRSNNKM